MDESPVLMIWLMIHSWANHDLNLNRIMNWWVMIWKFCLFEQLFSNYINVLQLRKANFTIKFLEQLHFERITKWFESPVKWFKSFYLSQKLPKSDSWSESDSWFVHSLRCAAMTVQTGTRLTAFSIFGLVPLHFGLITNLECQSFSWGRKREGEGGAGSEEGRKEN